MRPLKGGKHQVDQKQKGLSLLHDLADIHAFPALLLFHGRESAFVNLNTDMIGLLFPDYPFHLVGTL